MGRLRVLLAVRRARLRLPGAGGRGHDHPRCLDVVLGAHADRVVDQPSAGCRCEATAPSRPRTTPAARRPRACWPTLNAQQTGTPVADRALPAGGRRRLDRGRHRLHRHHHPARLRPRHRARARDRLGRDPAGHDHGRRRLAPAAAARASASSRSCASSAPAGTCRSAPTAGRRGRARPCAAPTWPCRPTSSATCRATGSTRSPTS